MSATGVTQASNETTSLRPFRLGYLGADLADLSGPVSDTRWPERETVEDGSQGVSLALVEGPVRHWSTLR